jgi:hypothetical protein
MSKWTQRETKRALEMAAWTALPVALAILAELIERSL